jgi:hypothetical protein
MRKDGIWNGLHKRHGNGGKSVNGKGKADGRKMKVRITIDTQVQGENGTHRSKIWEGELDILNHTEYLTMVSVIAEGEPQPICQVPFAIGIGHYIWVPDDPIGQVDPKTWNGGDMENGNGV